jgi:hypothetical protein
MKRLKNKFGVLTLCAVLLSMSPFQLGKCEILAIEVHTELQNAGMSHADAYHMSGIIQGWCEADLM